MNTWKRRMAGLLAGFIFMQPVFSQADQHRYELGAALSGFIYQGDLTPERLGSYKTMRPGIQLHGSILLSHSFLARTNLTIGGLRGDEAKYDKPEFRSQRAFQFRTPLVELTQLLAWNPLGTNYRERGFAPYVFAGAGISWLNIKRDWSRFNAAYFGDGSDLQARLGLDTARSVPRFVPVIPLGAGIRYGISPAWVVQLETSYRLIFTDYLDGFSQAANPDLDDHYQTISAGLIYRVGKKNTLACPVIRY